jgi:hypothetical protein
MDKRTGARTADGSRGLNLYSGQIRAKLAKVSAQRIRLDEIMQAAHVVEQMKFGLNLMRLSRAVSGQEPVNTAELEDEIRKNSLVREGRLAS